MSSAALLVGSVVFVELSVESALLFSVILSQCSTV